MKPDEIDFLRRTCPYLTEAYLRYLSDFRLKPAEQVDITFRPIQDTGSDDDLGDLEYSIKGLWVETILYEIPLLALTSEAYFKFCDKDWDHEGQEEKAYRKGMTLLENGCIFSEFGSRRRRDYITHDLVMKGLIRAAADAKEKGYKGVFSGTSNVHFAHRYGVKPVGTVAHEWYMAIAAYTDDYENANELGLRYWLGCFGEGVRFYQRETMFSWLTIADPGNRIDRYVWNASIPRCIQETYSRVHHRRRRRRADAAV